ncbi:MAG TPA: response regulator transcription factor [Acidimicrobiales bacterium]|nr:response regulator transcription factor [Acidimicrobiales bacterium]
MAHVLLIEDDDRIRETTRFVLEDEGFQVAEERTGEAGVDACSAHAPDCVLLDLMLPGMDGFETCRALRRTSDVPILMLTARADSYDVVAGLEAGADDYVTKPFEPDELVARVRALLRRTGRTRPEVETIVLGDLEIRPDAGVVFKAGELLSLTKTEFLLLCELAASPGRVFTRDVLLETVWGYAYAGDGKIVDTHVHRLRRKIEDDPTEPQHIVTVRGLGYRAVR